MTSSGQILTFYSYKGGVGRSMGLANVAALLSKWRRKVLVVDWDLEAPGIEVYFNKVDRDLPQKRKSMLGVIDLIKAINAGELLDWHDCLLSVRPFTQGEEIKIISAGKDDENYVQEVQRTDWNRLFDSRDLGIYIERLRNSWKEEFDYILVDSRTGITDIGGVCTIHLPDYLVVWFTTNWTSVNGVNYVARRARVAQDRLPFDRNKLLVLPVPSRDESRTEFEKANKWKDVFADKFSEYYRDWIPSDVEPADVIDKLRIPYIPYWSFEEGLPVCEEDARDPSSISGAYEVLSRLIFFELRWEEVDKGPEQSIEYLSRAIEVDIHRFGPELADKLFDQALALWKQERKDDASEATRKAVEIWEKIAETDLESYGLKLAKAKKFRSELVEERDEQGSIAEANGAINIYRRLYKIDKVKFQEEVATSLTELAIRLHDKEAEGAIETLGEATDIQKDLARSNPRRFEADLANGLYDLSNWFFQAEQFSMALVAIQETVPIYKRLISVDKDRFEPELADSLITLSECLLETGHMQGALGAGREAVETYKRLAQTSGITQNRPYMITSKPAIENSRQGR